MKTEVLNLIIASLAAICTGFLIIPVLIKNAARLGMIDQPDERKQHVGLIPTAGGIAFLPAVLTALIVFSPEPLLAIPMFIIAITGFVDDTKDMRATLKLAIQLAVATSVYYLGFRFESLHGLMGIYTLPEIMSFLITVVFIVAVTNAFNLIDGVDALAGGIAFVNAVIFTIIFYVQGAMDWALVSAILGGVLLAYLRFNMHPARIFMGDTGSLIIGVTTSILFLQVWTGYSKEGYVVSTSLVIIPLLDMVRMFIKRIAAKQSPFKADRGHIHHMMLSYERDHRKVSLTIIAQHIFFLLLAMVYCESFGFTDAFLAQIGSASLVYITLEIRRTAIMASRINNIKYTSKQKIKDNQFLKKHLS